MSNWNFFRLRMNINGESPGPTTTETFTIETTRTQLITISSVANKTPYVKLATTWTTTGGLVSSGGNAEGENVEIDLSSASGTTYITVTVYKTPTQVFDYFFWNGASGGIWFMDLDFTNNTDLKEVTVGKGNDINLSTLTNLTYFSGYNNNWSTLDISNNVLLEELNFGYSSQLTTLDIGSNTKLTTVLGQANRLSASGNDDIYIDLDSHGLSNGSVTIQSSNRRTSASNNAIDSLISKGWTVSNPYSTAEISNVVYVNTTSTIQVDITVENLSGNNPLQYRIEVSYDSGNNYTNLGTHTFTSTTYTQTHQKSILYNGGSNTGGWFRIYDITNNNYNDPYPFTIS